MDACSLATPGLERIVVLVDDRDLERLSGGRVLVFRDGSRELHLHYVVEAGGGNRQIAAASR